MCLIVGLSRIILKIQKGFAIAKTGCASQKTIDRVPSNMQRKNVYAGSNWGLIPRKPGEGEHESEGKICNIRAADEEV